MKLALALTAALLLAWLAPSIRWMLRGLHLLQLEEYRTGRYARWLKNNLRAGLYPFPVGSFAAIAFASAILPRPLALLAPVPGVAVGVWQSLTYRNPAAKKPLVLTARAKRLVAGWAVAVAAVLAGAIGINFSARPTRLVARGAIGLFLVSLLSWPLLLVANLLLYPVEAGFRRYYLWSAKRVLRARGATVIGVAGSYGKTSTKLILAQILSTKYPTLATPRSFNTPMGLCRVIREQLKPEHRFFVAELGAYERGEIVALCELVEPTIGILTAVGPEHLERFGSMENVREAEFELIAALPPNGLAVFNGEDETCQELARRTRCRAVVVGGGENPVLWAENVALTPDGLHFRVVHRDGQSAPVQTRLLGRHNVANILAAAAVALECGLTFEELPGAIRSLEPIEHRLQLLPNPNRVVVIDDTYNANPRGAAAALETLAAFSGGRRYLVTPGMVELADLTDEAHRTFGRQAAEVCDAVILVGPRQTRAIAEGLAESGFAPDRLFITRNLDEATEHLKTLLRPGDAVLFENDLPDQYQE
jgi:UDP-N-acetylmuramoyl-tripeptide--D-alanyl-D-alanine ligase